MLHASRAKSRSIIRSALAPRASRARAPHSRAQSALEKQAGSALVVRADPAARPAMFDDEVSIWWCLGDTWRCTPAEAIGIWSVIFFWSTMFIGTVIHGVIQHQTGTVERNDEATRRHVAANEGEEWVMLCSFMIWFFSFAAGCLLWVAAGVRWVHPVQMWQVQLLGSAILVGCALLFIRAHIDMGENWSPEAEQKARHQLVTHGTFRWARHPIYAVFLWAFVGTLLATLNWLIALCVFGAVLMVLRRIETEERILISLFGSQYTEYRRRVSALGPPWSFLGFDHEMAPEAATHARDAYRPLAETEAFSALVRGRRR